MTTRPRADEYHSAGVAGVLIFEADIHALFAEYASTYAPLLRLMPFGSSD